MQKKGKTQFWSFVSDNIISLSTIVAGIGVAIWQAIAAPANLNPILLAILGLLCLLATSEIVESRRRLDRLQDTVDNEINGILALLGSAQVTRFPDSERGYVYLRERIKSAKMSIDHASIDIAPRSTAKEIKRKYMQTRDAVVNRGEIRYRYLFYANEFHVEKVKHLLVNSVRGKFFAAGFPRMIQSTPMLFFVILDSEEVYVRSPYEMGEKEVYISIRQPDIVDLFSQWFRRLWATAKRIDPLMPHEEQVAELEHLADPKQ